MATVDGLDVGISNATMTEAAEGGGDQEKVERRDGVSSQKSVTEIFAFGHPVKQST